MKRFKTRKFQIPTEGQPTVIITDDGHSVRAEWSTGANSSISVGIRRPPPKPGDTVQATFSADKRYFYLPTYVPMDVHLGAWMSVETFVSKEEAEAKCRKGIFGPAYVEITLPKEDNRVLYRELLHFNSWKVELWQEPEELSKDDALVKDYLAMCHAHDMESMRRFDEAIAFTGRDYAWILRKIGDPVPADIEPVPPILTD